MFYCDICAKKHNWPNTDFKSFGPCEICGKITACNDIESKRLRNIDSSKKR